MNSSLRPDSKSLVETVLVLLLLVLLLFALYDVLRVFFGVLTFALIFSVSFHKPFEKFVLLLHQRRKLAAVIYCILITGIVALPFIYIISALGHHVKDAIHWINEAKINGLPTLPDWIARLPFVGDELNDFWQQVQSKPKEVLALHEHQIKGVLHTILTGGTGLIGSTLEVIAGIIVSAVFLVNSEKVLRPFRMAMKHMLGEKDAVALETATTQAIKGVSVGVMGTAFIAAVVSWIGLAIAGIPFALGLAALIFFLVLIQVGPLVVWVPLIIWLAVEGHTGWAIFIAAYGVLLLGIDSVLKPVLIAKSGKLPFLVLFAGVIGGMVAWGFTGMFKGAIILAVFYTIFNSWLEKKNNQGYSYISG